jgi:superoxide dismutase, Fe-Mn family
MRQRCAPGRSRFVEELIAMNSMILHELFFDGLSEQSEPGKVLREAITRDFGSYER